MDKNHIPHGWRNVKLSEVATFERGVEPGSEAYNTKGLGLPFIRVSDINGKKNRLFTEIDTDKICSEDEILLALDGSPGTVVRGIRGVFSSGIRKVHSTNKSIISENYLFHLLQAGTIQDIIKRYTIGSTILHAGSSIDFMETAIPSEVKEQDKIAEILTTVDENLVETDKVIVECENIKKGLMQKFFNKESYKQMTAKKFDDVLVKLKRGYSLATNSEGRGVRYLTSGNLLGDEVNLKDKKYLDTDKPLDNCLLKKNDILLNCVNSPERLGKAAIFERADELIVVGFNNFGLEFKEFVDPQYAKYFCLSGDFQKTIISISKPAVQQVSFSGNDLLKSNFYYPELKEQKRISSALVSIDARIKNEKNKKNELDNLKKSLMQKLLSGEMRVKV